MAFGGVQRSEGSEVPAPACLRIRFAGIEAVLARFQSLDHVDLTIGRSMWEMKWGEFTGPERQRLAGESLNRAVSLSALSGMTMGTSSRLNQAKRKSLRLSNFAPLR